LVDIQRSTLRYIPEDITLLVCYTFPRTHVYRAAAVCFCLLRICCLATDVFPLSVSLATAVSVAPQFLLWANMPRHLHSYFHLSGKGKAIPVQAVEALRVVRGWGSHIFRHSAHRWR
jgi:hypothetical protein